MSNNTNETLIRNKNVSELLAFTSFAERLPDRVLQLISEAQLGISALEWVSTLEIPSEKDKEVVKIACQWIDDKFLLKAFNC